MKFNFRARSLRVGMAFVTSIAVTAAVLSGGHAAEAADSDINIRSIDTRTPGIVQMGVLLPQGKTVKDVRIQENGRSLDADVKSFGDAGVPTGIALLIDSSAESVADDTLEKEKAAAIKLVQDKAPGQKFAIIAYNTGARPVVNFTDNTQLLTDGINKLTPSGDSALWDGLRLASALFQNEPTLQPNIVVMNASREAVSNATEQQALDGLRDADASLFAITVKNAAVNEGGALQGLIGATNGRYYEATESSAITPFLAGIGTALEGQASITYPSDSSGAIDITVTVGDASVIAHAAQGTLAVGAATTPDAVAAKNLGVLGGPLGIVLLGVLALAGVGILVYILIDLAGSDRGSISRALSPYNTDKKEERDMSKMADSDFIKRAVAETAKFAESKGFLETVEKRLEQAQIPLKPAEAIFFTAAVAVLAMFAGLFLADLIGLVIAGLVFGYAPVAFLSAKAKLRRRKFTKQLPDTLQLMAGSLRAGYSLIQGLDAVAKQVEAPMGTELTRALSEARLGRPVEEALEEVSDRMQSDDFEWAVMAIKIQREVGGNLAELLITVADTMVERERLRREVKALTAEGRMSAIILVALPPVIGGVVSLLNPTYMVPLYTTFIGQALLVLAVVMIGIGYWAMTKLTQIEA